VNGIAARHKLTIVRRLETGAVLAVPAGFLAELAGDPDLDTLSADQVVRSHMAITDATIGADLVQSGASVPGGKRLSGAGITVAVIDSGVAPLAQFRDGSSPTWISPAR
jgi:hypothetical protein